MALTKDWPLSTQTVEWFWTIELRRTLVATWYWIRKTFPKNISPKLPSRLKRCQFRFETDQLFIAKQFRDGKNASMRLRTIEHFMAQPQFDRQRSSCPKLWSRKTTSSLERVGSLTVGIWESRKCRDIACSSASRAFILILLLIKHQQVWVELQGYLRRVLCSRPLEFDHVSVK